MAHIMIANAPYYEDIATELLAATIAELEAAEATYEVFDVAGVLELPLAVKMAAMREAADGKPAFDGFIALGCVIRGETSHYDTVCNESARGLMQLSVQYNLPIANGVLTCENKTQAMVRADRNDKNKGADFAQAVLGLIALKKEFGL